MSTDENIMLDPDKTKDYCNYVVKFGIQENKDYIFVSAKIWKYLYQIYKGKEIKRFIITINDESNLT